MLRDSLDNNEWFISNTNLTARLHFRIFNEDQTSGAMSSAPYSAFIAIFAKMSDDDTHEAVLNVDYFLRLFAV